MKKGSTVIVGLVILVLIFAVTTIFFFLQTQKDKTPSPANQVKQPISSPTSSPGTSNDDETANWETYTGKLINVSFKVPPNWSVEEKDGVLYQGEKVNTSIRVTGSEGGFTFTKNVFRGFSGIKQVRE